MSNPTEPSPSVPSPSTAPEEEAMQQRIAEIQARRVSLHNAESWHFAPTREPWPGVFHTDANGYTFPLARLFGSGREVEAEAEGAFIAWAPEDIDFLLSALQSATARAERAEQDAARYRYVRDAITSATRMPMLVNGHRCTPLLVTGEQYDAIIDAAMASSSPPPGASA